MQRSLLLLLHVATEAGTFSASVIKPPILFHSLLITTSDYLDCWYDLTITPIRRF